jgi:starvation-inducible DNA-binding protein
MSQQPHPQQFQERQTSQSTVGDVTNQQPSGGTMQSTGQRGQMVTQASQSQGGSGGQQQMPAQQQGGVGQQFATRTYLPEQTRTTSIQRLNRCLADTTVLLSQARYAHWNLKGAEFYQLHELFEDLAEVLESHADDIAERATALGGQALGTARMAVSTSHVQPLPGTAVDGLEFVSLLADRLATHDANLSHDIEATTDAGDVDTADLLNEVSRDVAKYLWFLEAHLQSQPVSGSAGGGMQQQQLQGGASQYQQQTGGQYQG